MEKYGTVSIELAEKVFDMFQVFTDAPLFSLKSRATIENSRVHPLPLWRWDLVKKYEENMKKYEEIWGKYED